MTKFKITRQQTVQDGKIKIDYIVIERKRNNDKILDMRNNDRIFDMTIPALTIDTIDLGDLIAALENKEREINE